MAKKQKRQASSGARISADPAAAAPRATQAVQPANGTVRSRPGDFNPDYSYVIRDLKRIAVLAGSFILLLVVLSFFLR